MRIERTGRGPETREVPPEHCPNGHSLRHPNVQVFWLGCTCAGGYGHRGWRCWACGAVCFHPPHTDDSQSSGRERGR